MGLKKRINIQYMFLTLLTIVAAVTISSLVFYELIKKEVVSDLRTYADLMVKSDAWEIATNPQDNTIAVSMSDEKQIRITLIDPDGRAIYDSDADIGYMENHRERPEVAEAFESGNGQAIRKSETMGKSAFYYAVKMDNGCVLRVSKKVSSLTSILFQAMPIMAILCVNLFILCVILSNLLTRSIIGPIERLAGNLDASDSVKVYKELVPFVTTIRKQHEDIMRNANMRQEFTANVSHELKTPLTSISGYSELIESGMANDSDVVRFAGEIHKSSNRLLTLINDIIRLSELDGEIKEDIYEEVNLYEIAGSCVDMLQMSAVKHNVTIELHGSNQYVKANKQMMEELIYNLCDNAIRYNNPGGSVDVTVEYKNAKTVVEVKDTGIGIPKEHQERIFERFYRVDKSRSKSTGGTGLGLAIVKHIVAKHPDASLELESEEGKGTTIRVLFD